MSYERLLLQLVVPWNEQHRSEQLNQVAVAMAYIHTSSLSAISVQHCHQMNVPTFFSPLTFQQFVYIFKLISAYISKREKVICFSLFSFPKNNIDKNLSGERLKILHCCLFFQGEIEKYSSCLARVTEAHNTINDWKRNISDLGPRHARALSVVQEFVDSVELQRLQYIQVYFLCFNVDYDVCIL